MIILLRSLNFASFIVASLLFGLVLLIVQLGAWVWEVVGTPSDFDVTMACTTVGTKAAPEIVQKCAEHRERMAAIEKRKSLEFRQKAIKTVERAKLLDESQRAGEALK